jgi:hypothetical protein
MIIRNTELAAAQEKFEKVEKQYKEVHVHCLLPTVSFGQTSKYDL